MLVDLEEKRTFKQYMGVSYKLHNLGTLDYHYYLLNHPDQIVKQDEWTQITDSLYDEECYRTFDTKGDVMMNFKNGDLEAFDTYGNFDYTKLDSYKIEQIIQNDMNPSQQSQLL